MIAVRLLCRLGSSDQRAGVSASCAEANCLYNGFRPYLQAATQSPYKMK